MASIVEQTPYNEYTGNGVATAYGFEFQLLDNGDFVASIDGVEVPSSDYTLSSLTQAGGTCTFDTAPANGTAVLLERVIALERDTDYQYNGDLREETLDRDFNRLWQALQGQAASLGGALRLPYPEMAAEFPSAANRINKLVGFDALGELTLTAPADGSSVSLAQQLADPTVVGNGDAMLAVKNSASVALSTTQHQKNEDAFTAMDVVDDLLKAAIRALTSTVDLALTLQPYMQYCYTNDRDVVWPAGQYSFTPIVITCTGGNFSHGFKITGAGQNVTRLRKNGSSSSSLITIQSADPVSGAPVSIQLFMSDLTIDGVGETGPGLRLAGVAVFHIDNVGITDTTVAIDLQSSLIGSVTRCKIVSNQVGIKSRKTGVAYCNHLTIGDNQLTNNTQFALDIGACDTLNVYDNQIEENGVNQSTATVTISNATPAVVTWNSHGLSAEDPVVFTTSGSLPTGLVVDYCYYVSATGLSANSFQVSATPGGASLATSSAGSGTHTASSARTGAVVLRDTCVDELGSAVFNFQGNRFEGNRGSDLRAEYMSTAFGATLHLECSQMAGTNDGPMILIGYMRKVEISHSWAPVGSSTWNICCEQGQLENVEVINLKRPRVQPSDSRAYWTITNARFGGVDHVSGEKVSWIASLTGCTTVPTVTVQSTIQGKHVTHFTTATAQGVSNTNAASLTGMPPDMWPLTASTQSLWTRDNGTNDVIGRSSVGTNGVISLGNGNSSVFTASGNKGVATNTFAYQI